VTVESTVASVGSIHATWEKILVAIKMNKENKSRLLLIIRKSFKKVAC
jgi:hypothetical protein